MPVRPWVYEDFLGPSRDPAGSKSRRDVELRAEEGKQKWIWIAMDATTRQIIAFHVGDRSRESGKELWANIPLVYREQATFHTDQYEVYKGVIPAK